MTDDKAEHDAYSDVDNDAPAHSGYDELTLDDSSSASKATKEAWSDLDDVLDEDGNIIRCEFANHNDADNAGDKRRG